MSKSVLFLCTGNSCRSQMAEGFAKSMLDGAAVYSAGIEAHGINPLAVAVMAEMGIDISEQASQEIDTALLGAMDLVVTVCGDADEKCPLLPSNCTKVHWPLEDPAKLTGSEESVLQGFRDVRDEIKQGVETLRPFI